MRPSDREPGIRPGGALWRCRRCVGWAPAAALCGCPGRGRANPHGVSRSRRRFGARGRWYCARERCAAVGGAALESRGGRGLRLDTQTIEEVTRHAREAYPNECCGVVLRRADGTQLVIRIRNIQDEMHERDPHRYPRTARIAYAGHPADLKVALDLAEEPGNSLAALYHSHPDHDAYFSDEDVAQATPFGEPSYPEALQVVVSIHGGEVRAIKLFRWDSDSGSFEETR